MIQLTHTPKDQTQCFVRPRAKPFIRSIYYNSSSHLINITSLAQLAEGGSREGAGLSCPFLKLDKKCPKFGKKFPDFTHLWVKFLI